MGLKLPVVLIGGAPRVGKTRLARRLAAHTGFDVIHCDKFRKGFWSIADEHKRQEERWRHYEETIARRRTGMIVEGSDLVTYNRGDGKLLRQGLISSDNRLSFKLLEYLKNRFEAKIFIVGCLEADPARVLKTIRLHETKRNLTKTFSDKSLENYIRRSFQRSEKLRAMAMKKHIPYLELGGDDFDHAIEEAASSILHELDRSNWGNDIASPPVRR